MTAGDAATPTPARPADGLIVVDKPPGWTSHDVVARIRRLAGTRRVGHAGTLDPMATGVLVVGLGRATRLLGHLAGHDKAYDATIRLGVSTTTDDADGEALTTNDASGIDDRALETALAALVGDIDQVPSSVSAIKVAGERAYARVRKGEHVELAARRVHVAALHLVDRRGDQVDVHVECSTGTYVRALARDVGAALGVGAHLTALRRTRVGSFDLASAHRLDELEERLVVVPLADAVASVFPRWDVDAEAARRLGLGQRLEPVGLPAGPVGVFGPAGEVV
ncbi:MAG: tRNA pseudouridine55 synthase, partial [Frankiaceae bacterium]|nr:tRNA pseudouridine55 synthase [Frankiaceae bacterium]